MKDAKETTQDAIRMALGLPEIVKTAKGMDSTKRELKRALGINQNDDKNTEKTTEKNLSK
jgi:hypothetical protein